MLFFLFLFFKKNALFIKIGTSQILLFLGQKKRGEKERQESMYSQVKVFLKFSINSKLLG